jgi:hypothetical protein
MISHELKCIFIHIPRTAGSSIERSLIGRDWWSIDNKTKHLTASQAKKIYSEYWNDYFKFSFIRNPYSRMLSMARFSEEYYGCKRPGSGIITSKHINGYKKLFGDPILVEHDSRFYKREEVLNGKHKENCVYSNILDESIDFTGRFETLEVDFKNICSILGLNKDKLYTQRDRKIHRSITLSLDAKDMINELYSEDFLKYNYKKE